MLYALFSVVLAVFINVLFFLATETTVVGHSAPTAAAIVTGAGALPSSHHGYDQQRPSQQQYNNRSSNSNNSTSSQSQSSSHSSSQPSTQSSSRSNTNENCFGIVVSIKETFGFIQPLLAEEQIFFSLHGTHGLSIGDEVSYVSKSTSKGMQADNVRVLEASKKAYLQGVRGVITREPDQHRGTPGILSIFNYFLSCPSCIPLLPTFNYLLIPPLTHPQSSSHPSSTPLLFLYTFRSDRSTTGNIETITTRRYRKIVRSIFGR